MIRLWDKAPGQVEGWEEPYLVFYGKKTEEKRPAMIVCPGGGYFNKMDYEGRPVAEWFTESGFQGFVLNYRTVPYQYYAYMDVTRAIRYIRYHADEFGVDPDKIAVSGFSAGGHLSAFAGTNIDKGDVAAVDPIDRISGQANAMVLCYPVIDYNEQGSRNCLPNLLGRQPTDEEIQRESAQSMVTRDTCPAFIWHTSEDNAIDVRNSLTMAVALREHEIPFEMHIFPYGPHGMIAGNNDPRVAQWLPHVNQWQQLCINWFRIIGFFG